MRVPQQLFAVTVTLLLGACTGTGPGVQLASGLTPPATIAGQGNIEMGDGGTAETARTASSAVTSFGGPAEGATPAALQSAETAALQPGTATASVRFMPIIGAPSDAVSVLSQELAEAARMQNIAVRSVSDTSTDNILKGYFSAINDGSKTSVVYVWDVLDNTGRRLHRIQGQETIPGATSDPWSTVTPAALSDIADRVMSEYRAWEQRSTG